jgi:hypothetical protein
MTSSSPRTASSTVYRRALRALEPADYVFHLLLLCSRGLTDNNRPSLRWENWLSAVDRERHVMINQSRVLFS